MATTTRRRLLSFDVGIKNLAYCIIDFSSIPIQLVEWNVLNLCEPEHTPKTTCSEILKNKKVCGKVAKYTKTTYNCCDRHSRNSLLYRLPDKAHSTASLKKLKIEELRELKKGIVSVSSLSGCKKEEILSELLQYYRETEWDLIISPKKQNAGKIDLITLGRSLHAQLTANPIMTTVTHVIIENQISPIANRMKTIQGMIAQHYISSLGDSASIEFVSSGNKLKNMVKQSNAATGYKQNKQDGIFYCEKYLKDNHMDQMWLDLLSTSHKKDDLCDCFLQALWWKDH